MRLDSLEKVLCLGHNMHTRKELEHMDLPLHNIRWMGYNLADTHTHNLLAVHVAVAVVAVVTARDYREAETREVETLEEDNQCKLDNYHDRHKNQVVQEAV